MAKEELELYIPKEQLGFDSMYFDSENEVAGYTSTLGFYYSIISCGEVKITLLDEDGNEVAEYTKASDMPEDLRNLFKRADPETYKGLDIYISANNWFTISCGEDPNCDEVVDLPKTKKGLLTLFRDYADGFERNHQSIIQKQSIAREIVDLIEKNNISFGDLMEAFSEKNG